MPRYIDADAFKEKYGDYYAEEGTTEGFIGTVGQLIDNAPTVEIAPLQYKTYCKGVEDGKKIARPKGMWRVYQYQESRKKDWYCTNCATIVKKPLEKKYIFCPYCGADMR